MKTDRRIVRVLWVLAALAACSHHSSSIEAPTPVASSPQAAIYLFRRIATDDAWASGPIGDIAGSEGGLYEVREAGGDGWLCSVGLHPLHVAGVRAALRTDAKLHARELDRLVARVAPHIQQASATPTSTTAQAVLFTGLPRHPYVRMAVDSGSVTYGITDRLGRLIAPPSIGLQVVGIVTRKDCRFVLVHASEVVDGQVDLSRRVLRPDPASDTAIMAMDGDDRECVVVSVRRALRGTSQVELSLDATIWGQADRVSSFKGDLTTSTQLIVGWTPHRVQMVVSPRDRMHVCVPASVSLGREAIAESLIDLGEFCGVRCRLLPVTLPDHWVRKELDCNWSSRPSGPSRVVYAFEGALEPKSFADMGGEAAVEAWLPSGWLGNIRFFLDQDIGQHGSVLGEAVVSDRTWIVAKNNLMEK